MSRKIKFSNNWRKAKTKVNKIHHDIANARKDFLHKTTTAICKNHALVCIEDLRIKNMSKSSKGTIENPGKNVAQKAGLNKAILDQGWAMFYSQLECKMAWNGGMVIAVPPQYTSQTCLNSECGHIAKSNRKTQAIFKCVKCGYTNHADIVGATNILSRGMQILDKWQDTADASAGYENAARIACQVNGAVRPSAAGTRRDDLRDAA